MDYNDKLYLTEEEFKRVPNSELGKYKICKHCGKVFVKKNSKCYYFCTEKCSEDNKLHHWKKENMAVMTVYPIKSFIKTK